MKKIAVIIGGSSGIGLATAKALSAECLVVNMSRTRNDLTIVTDVTSEASVKNSFEELVRRFGRPDIMVYSAGFVEPQGILEIQEDILKKTVETNLFGAFYCTKWFVRYRQKTGGKIIYIASTAGTRAQPGWCAYSASKAGLINFALTMAEELRPYNIKAYCLTPGRCATNLRKKLAPCEDQSKIMQPDDVANVIRFLVSDNVLDGQALTVRRRSTDA